MADWACTLCLRFSVLLVLAVCHPSVASQAKWRLPVTIEAVRDVTIRRPDTRLNRRQPRGVLDGPNNDPIIIKKGMRFLMVEVMGEGGGVIEFERQRFTQSSCWWLDGFTDHQADFFRVHLQPTVPPPPR